jgi:NADH dehydrogenase
MQLAGATGLETDRGGRLKVQPDLSLPGYPDIFVVGDLASFPHQTGEPLPGIAPVAMQQGRYVAKLIKQRINKPDSPATPFHYSDRGSLATIGRALAVGQIRGINVSGWFAWLTWLFVHLMYLVEYENRLLVLIQWGWNYITRNRSARLITNTDDIDLDRLGKPKD